MNKIIRKSDVQTHNLNDPKRRKSPALCVVPTLPPSIEATIQSTFGCSEFQAQKALKEIVVSQQQRFFPDAHDIFDKIYTTGTIFSTSKCKEWLIALGLPPLDKWDAMELNKWRHFSSEISKYLKQQYNKKHILEVVRKRKLWKET